MSKQVTHKMDEVENKSSDGEKEKTVKNMTTSFASLSDEMVEQMRSYFKDRHADYIYDYAKLDKN